MPDQSSAAGTCSEVFRGQAARLGMLLDLKGEEGGRAAATMMIRVYQGAAKGATAFFRNRLFLDLLVDSLAGSAPERPTIFFHSCSIGAEPYSLALWYLHRAGPAGAPLPLIEASDLEPSFLQVARAGVYPRSILEGMNEEERRWFEEMPEGLVRVPAAARELVSFLPARSFLDPLDGGPYDAVLAMNALTYVSPAEQGVAIGHMAARARHLLGLTAFHPDSIRADLGRVGFAPVTAGARAIHDAWVERRVPLMPTPGTPEYSWQLPPFDTAVADRDHRFCSLFARTAPWPGPERS